MKTLHNTINQGDTFKCLASTKKINKNERVIVSNILQYRFTNEFLYNVVVIGNDILKTPRMENLHKEDFNNLTQA